MKKIILSSLLALAMCLSLTVPAFADVSVDGSSKGLGEVTHTGDAQFVSANDARDNLTVTGNVTGDREFVVSVSALNGAQIDIRGNVASSTADSINTKGTGSETQVTVGGNVTNNSGSNNGNAIYANGTTKVKVGGAVTESGVGHAIDATTYAKVEVTNVIENDDGDGIQATKGASVTVEGNVTESGDGYAIDASDGATVIVIGTVTESGLGYAIKAGEDTTVKVGGNVTGDDANSAINILDSTALVIVEGLVTGDINNTDAGTIYLGQLAGDITGSKDSIHYLIGSADNSPVKLSEVSMLSNCAGGYIYGVNGEEYKYTTTANQTSLKGKIITLKPADGKILTVSGFDGADVTYVENADGTVTFTIGENFTGGLQNLVLNVTDKHTHNPAKVNGQAATKETSGWKDYYKCDCGKFFEDATCKVEITDLDAWKAAGGNGHIAKLEEEPTSPQTGDNSHMALWVMLLALSSMGLCACGILGKKRKNER